MNPPCEVLPKQYQRLKYKSTRNNYFNQSMEDKE